ncbi:macrophage mannose receptor 1 [Ictalurus punctatus]|uniref:Macrophage mannose receptor 1 n=1 Tax=Ictalurus punctatus TaxID=7998 RepID=A0A2D0QCZ7_ICTPU|nr:macrophage mannose receptor 1 [Ictalurus punctatus]
MKLNHFLLLCLTGFVSITLQDDRHQYYLIKNLATWSDAQSYCKSNYDNLATVQTDDDWERFNIEAESKGVPATGWIGLYNNVNTWYLINNGIGVYISRSFWAPGQPDNAGGNQACGAINASGYWLDYYCGDQKPFICYDAIQGFVAVNSSMYTFGQTLWYCQTHHKDIASPLNETQNNELQQLAMLQGTSWIGLFRSTWKWSDSTTPTTLRWAPGFPNNVDHNDNCASANNSLIVDRQCNSQFYFFCHTKYIQKTQTLKLKIKGDKSVFDPAVQSAILQQLTLKLNDHGLSRDTQVAWKVQQDGSIFYKKSKDDL